MDSHFELKIPLTRQTVIIVLLIMLFLVVAGTYAFQTYLQFRSSIDFLRNLAVAALTIASILITASSIRDGIHERRQASAFALIARFNNPSFFEHILAWTLIWREIEGMPDDQLVATIEGPGVLKQGYLELDTDAVSDSVGLAKNEKKRRVAVQMFNFFEEIAIAVEAKGVDEKILRDYFKDILEQYYLRALPWIQYCQQNKGKEIYVKLDTLVARWKTNPPPATP